jgi:hypothetical protein
VVKKAKKYIEDVGKGARTTGTGERGLDEIGLRVCPRHGSPGEGRVGGVAAAPILTIVGLVRQFGQKVRKKSPTRSSTVKVMPSVIKRISSVANACYQTTP